MKDSLKSWAIKNFLAQFNGLAIKPNLYKNTDYKANSFLHEKQVEYNQLRVNFLDASLEYANNFDLYGISTEFHQQTNLHVFFNSDTEEEIINHFDRLGDKKEIGEYLKIIRKFIKNEDIVETEITLPDDFYGNNYFKKTGQVKSKIYSIQKFRNVKK